MQNGNRYKPETDMIAFHRLLTSCFVLLMPLLTNADKNMVAKKIDEAFEAGKLVGLHSVLVIHGGNVALEKHFNGTDETMGQDLGKIESSSARLHDLRSVTKSITSMLYGIALSEGIVPGLDEPVMSQFPQYPDLADNADRQKILVKHALSMTMGMEWNENLPYSDPRNSEIAMEMADDRYRFILDRPITNVPGEVWNYNGGATALIAHFIAKGAGKSLDVYANEKLFTPMNIQEFTWARGQDNEPMAASGLRLNIHDLSKFGRLVLQNGEWDGLQLVPLAWLDQSMVPQSKPPFEVRYGFFWWLSDETSPAQWAAGFGNGGQRIHIDKDNDLIVAMFAGNYNQQTDFMLPTSLLTGLIYPAIFSDL